MVMDGLHNMAVIKAFMERLSNGWTERQDCYNGRHKMSPEKLYSTDHFQFLQIRCKRCGLRKTKLMPLDD